MIGLQEPYAKRTVEGDLGLFHNLDTLAELTAADLRADDGQEAAFQERLRSLRNVMSVPTGDEQRQDQLMLTRKAVRTAVERHAGKLERRFTHNGEIWLQRGKDLTNIATLIGGGGPLAFSADPRFVLEGAVTGNEVSLILKPAAPSFLLDRRYILFAIGLLAGSEPAEALRIAKKYIEKI